MLTRVADNLYWMGRYLERAENQARLIDVQRFTPASRSNDDPWRVVLGTLGAIKEFEKAVAERPELTANEYLVYSEESPYSIRNTIGAARSLALELREHTSREVFESINKLFHAVAAASKLKVERGLLMQQVRDSVATVYGLFDNTVIHSEGAHWFYFGQLLERADMTSRIVDAKYFITLPGVTEVGGAIDRAQWRGVLRSASAMYAYQRTYLGQIRVDRVLDLLFLNPDFPRSLLRCVDGMRDEFEKATANTPPAWTLKPATELAVAQLGLRATTGARIVIEGLHEYIDKFQSTLIRVHEGVSDNLFKALPPEEGQEKTREHAVGRTLSLQSN